VKRYYAALLANPVRRADELEHADGSRAVGMIAAVRSTSELTLPSKYEKRSTPTATYERQANAMLLSLFGEQLGVDLGRCMLICDTAIDIGIGLRHALAVFLMITRVRVLTVPV
jgi:hypothetical protein